jgi:enamine deaminase RidA (YjgF/YER057c/UK114 family)
VITIRIRALVMLVLSAAAVGAAVPQLAPPLRAQGARRHINLPNRPIEAPFSDGVLVGNTLYLAGRIGFDPATGKPPAEVEAEVRLLLDGLKATLTAAGMTMDDLVSVQIHCPDLSLYDRFNKVYRSYFGEHVPARAFIGSGPLLRGGRFEAMGIAIKQ